MDIESLRTDPDRIQRNRNPLGALRTANLNHNPLVSLTLLRNQRKETLALEHRLRIQRRFSRHHLLCLFPLSTLPDNRIFCTESVLQMLGVRITEQVWDLSTGVTTIRIEMKVLSRIGECLLLVLGNLRLLRRLRAQATPSIGVIITILQLERSEVLLAAVALPVVDDQQRAEQQLAEVVFLLEFQREVSVPKTRRVSLHLILLLLVAEDTVVAEALLLEVVATAVALLLPLLLAVVAMVVVLPLLPPAAATAAVLLLVAVAVMVVPLLLLLLAVVVTVVALLPLLPLAAVGTVVALLLFLLGHILLKPTILVLQALLVLPVLLGPQVVAVAEVVVMLILTLLLQHMVR